MYTNIIAPEIQQARDYLLKKQFQLAYKIIKEHKKMDYLFASIDNQLPPIPYDIGEWDVSTVKSMKGLFYNRTDLVHINLSKWNTSNVRDVSYMFGNCKNLRNITIGTWNTQNVENAQGMFYNCYLIDNYPLHQWNTKKIVDMSYMFAQDDIIDEIINQHRLYDNQDELISKLQDVWDEFFPTRKMDISEHVYSKNEYVCEIIYNIERYILGVPKKFNISTWDVSNVKDMSNMFKNCANCTIEEVSAWNTKSIQDASHMFDGCTDFNADLSRWDVSSLANAEYMFNKCYKFNSDLSDWNISSLVNARCMFLNCRKLFFDMSKWNLNNIPNRESMFLGCYKMYAILPTNYDSIGYTKSQNNKLDKFAQHMVCLSNKHVHGMWKNTIK